MGGRSNSYSHSDQVAQNKEGQEFLLDKLKTKIRPTSLFFNLDPFFFFLARKDGVLGESLMNEKPVITRVPLPQETSLFFPL